MKPLYITVFLSWSLMGVHSKIFPATTVSCAKSYTTVTEGTKMTALILLFCTFIVIDKYYIGS